MSPNYSSDEGSNSEGGGAVSSRQKQQNLNQQKQGDASNLATAATEENNNAAKSPGPSTSGGTACGMPFEYCEFSGCTCAKGKQNQQEGTPEQAAQSGAQQHQHDQQLCAELEEKAQISEAKRGEGKKDGSKPKVVTVQKQAKRRGKCATNIWGLEHFGVKQEMAAKLASKSFACGSSFQKGQPGQAPCVEIQGDVEETVAAFLLKNFDIPVDKIVFLPEK